MGGAATYQFLATVALGTLLAAAGVLKWFSGAEFGSALVKLTSPTPWNKVHVSPLLFGRAVASMEMAIGLWLIFTGSTRAAIACSTLYLTFVPVTLLAIRRKAPCGCAGALSRKTTSINDLGRSILLAGVAVSLVPLHLRDVEFPYNAAPPWLVLCITIIAITVTGWFATPRQRAPFGLRSRRSTHVGTSGTADHVTRRRILVWAVSAVTAIIASPLWRPQRVQAAVYWGTDTNTRSCCGMPQNFYGGQLGGELMSFCGNFNSGAALAAGVYNSHMYWDLGGPGLTGGDPYQYGRAQAQAAVNAYYNGCNSQYVYGNCIFADIEAGNGGWGGNIGANQAVVNGFLDYVASYTVQGQRQFNPGIYTGPGFWMQYFGTSFRPSQAFVLWAASCHTCAIQCAPCNTGCSGTMSQVETSNVLWAAGGMYSVLWQYWVGGCPCGCDNCTSGDYNYLGQNPSSLSPFASPSTWICYGCGIGGCQ